MKTALITQIIWNMERTGALTQERDQVEMFLIEASRKHWRKVLSHLVAIIQSLAERNLVLRGTDDTWHSQNNSIFLKEVELLAKFDPVMRQHISKVESRMNPHATYLGKTTQN